MQSLICLRERDCRIFAYLARLIHFIIYLFGWFGTQNSISNFNFPFFDIKFVNSRDLSFEKRDWYTLLLIIAIWFWCAHFGLSIFCQPRRTHHGCDKLVKKLIWNVIAIDDIYLKYTCTILPMVLIQLQMTLFSNEKYDIRTICSFHMLK